MPVFLDLVLVDAEVLLERRICALNEPTVCGCFTVANCIIISSNFESLVITFAVKAVPISERIVFGMYDVRINRWNNCLATFGALAFLNGTAKRYLEKTSFAVKM